ncbi:EAL domain-containing protein [Crocosphaera sp. UHCC 0190]|uniref:EAL domain-containing protein n=1 Tax=Crocosphaera sp. UHCC 0190 TaxID=3110246 RepID=UPI002B216B4F|nr:EAL domain-containing protein [Crocosphaera sp. UHCC 0190]MEA5510578.1 EAL domain-containing protein [Crocosphaera sp. UHCC 0190]
MENLVESVECIQDKQNILAFNLTNNQRIFYLEQSQYSIGRSPENSIVIESEAISRFHATIFKQVKNNGEISFVIIDGTPQGELSRNGLFINGNRRFKHELQHGDIIQFEPGIQANYYILHKRNENFVRNLLPKVSTGAKFPDYKHQKLQDEAKRTMILSEETFAHSHVDLSKFASLIELSPNPILEINYEGNITYANSSAKLQFPDLKQAQLDHPILQELIDNHQDRQGNLLVREIKISESIFEQHVHYLPQENLIRSYLFDVTQRKEAEKILKYQAFHDTLTGLPNRTFFNEHLALSLGNAQRNETLMAILLLDLDGFKNINDTLGHGVGDQMLQCFAKRLQSQIRRGDLVCRWGGDEFTILLSQIKNPDEAGQFAQRLLEIFKDPVTVGKHQIYLKSSIGITIYPQDAQEQETLLKSADLALYKTKNCGRNNYQFYHPDMETQITNNFQLENSLHKAIEKEEFCLYYQPQINIRTGTIEAMEALIRWQNPELGLVTPNKFIALAEKTGLIIPIGEWVLKTACKQAQKWHSMGFPPFKIAVNLSAQQFQQSNLIEVVEQSLQLVGLEPKWLELEVTESTLMDNIHLACQTLEIFRDKGISISMDDFGTGYSSLGYLKQFPFQTLKIDRTFVKDINANFEDQAIISAIMTLSRGLNLRVVAEGVETKDQLNLLKILDCEAMQGFFFSRPLDSKKIALFLDSFYQKVA